MGKLSKPELSKKNKYWMDKQRYYELKHFVMQYPIWKKLFNSVDGYTRPAQEIIFSGSFSDPTVKAAEARERYSRWINMVDEAAEKADPILAKCIIEGVTNGISYDILQARMDVPCGKEKYYELYRKFFWILSGIRE